MNLLVNIDVDDLDSAIRFYTDAFALRVGRRFGANGVELLGLEAPIFLLVKEAGSPALGSGFSSRSYLRHWTPVHLDFVVEELDAAVVRAIAAGAILEAPAEQHTWGKMARFADPFGHGICILQFTGRGYDEVASNPDL